MNASNKILTVSYGTFSCTLEGFDEPFNTMRAIAEYFRDLAAEDRYFGAEPPTPDAAMLHRIAEREVQRRVEAKVNDNSVILTAGAHLAAPVPDPAASARPAQAPVVPRRPSIVAAAVEAVAPAAPEGVAAKLARLRGATPAAPEVAPSAPTFPEEFTEDLDEGAFLTETPGHGVFDLAGGDEVETAGEEADDTAAAIGAIAQSEPDLLAEAPDFTAILAAEDAAAAEAERPTLSEALANATPAEADALIAALVDVPAVDTAPGAEALAETEQDHGIDAMLQSLSTDAEHTPGSADATVAAFPEFDTDDGRDDSIMGFEDDSDLVETPVSGAGFGSGPTGGGAGLHDATRARVVKIRRSGGATAEAHAEFDDEFENADPDADPSRSARDAEARRQLHTDSEAVDRLMEHAASEMRDSENRRRQSALSHLKAAVAATVADRKVKSPDEGREEARTDAYRNDLARVVRPRRPEARGTPRPTPLVLVSEQRIDLPKTEPRVPLTTVGGSSGGYVRPRRVTTGTIAPQMLSDDEDGEDGDIAEAPAAFDGSNGFAEFAERLGATELPDLLEAAAAYMACVEGRPHFSRPQLIRQAAVVAPPAASDRESGLRSFGTLLRSGRISKIRRGQFVLAETSPFMVEARKVTG